MAVKSKTAVAKKSGNAKTSKKGIVNEGLDKVKHIEIIGDISIEKKLRALFSQQQIDSKIDRIRIVRGELPLEVQDLEDEIEGLETRVKNFDDEAKFMEESIKEKNNLIVECKNWIKKYEAQQNNVRNNREYDSLTKEMEYQNLEIQLAEKRIREFKIKVEEKQEIIAISNKEIEDKKQELDSKKAELQDIVAETEKDEVNLLEESKNNQNVIEDRLLTAYKRIRKNARNGLAVVTVERDACGGCFNKIPPQRQLDIRTRKKIIVCEHCGRILIDTDLAGSLN